MLSEVKLSAPDQAGPELPRPVILHHLGLPDQVVAVVDWWELDRTVEPDHLTSPTSRRRRARRHVLR